MGIQKWKVRSVFHKIVHTPNNDHKSQKTSIFVMPESPHNLIMTTNLLQNIDVQ